MARKRSLLGLDADNIITISDDEQAEQTRHATRSKINGRANALYDQKYHPMDDVLRPSRAAKRRRGSPHHSSILEIPDSEESEDDEIFLRSNSTKSPEPPRGGFKRERTPTRRSSRRKNGAKINYDTRIHPQDSQLSEAGAFSRRNPDKQKAETEVDLIDMEIYEQKKAPDSDIKSRMAAENDEADFVLESVECVPVNISSDPDSSGTIPFVPTQERPKDNRAEASRSHSNDESTNSNIEPDLTNFLSEVLLSRSRMDSSQHKHVETTSFDGGQEAIQNLHIENKPIISQSPPEHVPKSALQPSRKHKPHNTSPDIDDESAKTLENVGINRDQLSRSTTEDEEYEAISSDEFDLLITKIGPDTHEKTLKHCPEGVINGAQSQRKALQLETPQPDNNRNLEHLKQNRENEGDMESGEIVDEVPFTNPQLQSSLPGRLDSDSNLRQVGNPLYVPSFLNYDDIQEAAPKPSITFGFSKATLPMRDIRKPKAMIEIKKEPGLNISANQMDPPSRQSRKLLLFGYPPITVGSNVDINSSAPSTGQVPIPEHSRGASRFLIHEDNESTVSAPAQPRPAPDGGSSSTTIGSSQARSSLGGSDNKENMDSRYYIRPLNTRGQI